jgi:transcriptional regulator with XRE-family HTH domain
MKRKTITLREARQAAGMSLVELAQKSGVGWATIQAIEHGRTPGGLITRHHLSDALGVPFSQMWPDSIEETRELFEAMKRNIRRDQSIREAEHAKRQAEHGKGATA